MSTYFECLPLEISLQDFIVLLQNCHVMASPAHHLTNKKVHETKSDISNGENSKYVCSYISQQVDCLTHQTALQGKMGQLYLAFEHSSISISRAVKAKA